jgi:hypothetical protein
MRTINAKVVQPPIKEFTPKPGKNKTPFMVANFAIEENNWSEGRNETVPIFATVGTDECTVLKSLEKGQMVRLIETVKSGKKSFKLDGASLGAVEPQQKPQKPKTEGAQEAESAGLIPQPMSPDLIKRLASYSEQCSGLFFFIYKNLHNRFYPENIDEETGEVTGHGQAFPYGEMPTEPQLQDMATTIYIGMREDGLLRPWGEVKQGRGK